MMTINLQTAYDQARHFLETNDTERAIAVAQHILSSFPDNLEAHLILGEAHVAIRQFETAQKFLQRVIAADPENIPAHVGLGIIYERLGKAPQAVAEFEQALEIKPDMPELRSQLLRLYTDAWGPEGAQLRLSRAGLARLYAKGHMLLQAIQEFRSVIADHPDRFDARVGLAEVLWRDGQDGNAQAICKEILAERKDVLKANILLGYIKLATGDNEGERYWRVAQELDPYQNVAQAMFEVLPNTVEAKTTLPAWDEAAWKEQVAREARKQEEEAAAKALAAAPPPPQEAPPSTVSHPADEFDFGFGVPETPSLPKQPLEIPDEAFLANLLQVNNVAGATKHSAPHEPEDLLTDLELSPFSFDDFGDSTEHAPPRAADLVSQPSAPSKLPSPASVTPLPPEEVAEPEMRPFSLEELGLTEDEIKSFTDQPSPTPAPAPNASQEKGSESAFEEDFGMTPFSFDDFDLAAEEVSPHPQHDSPPAKAPSPSRPPVDGKSSSLPDAGQTKEAAQKEEPIADAAFEEDFGMAAFSFDDFEPSSKQAPPSAPAVEKGKGKPASQPRGDMPASFGMGFGKEPFSDDEDLALGEEDFALPSPPKAVESASAPVSKVTSTPKPSFSDTSDEDLGFEPFSLEDISSHEEANRVVPVVGRSDDDLPTAEAFDWSQQDAEPPPKEPSSVAEGYGFDSDESIDDLQPFAFSLDDLDIEESKAVDVGSRSLPPSLQPFSLEDSSDLPNQASLRPARPNAPLPEDDEISTDRGAFSWQLPASKPGTDFLHANTPKDQPKGSIFAKLQKQREELVLEVEEEVALPTLNEGDEEVSFFSDDDVHLWDEEQQVVPDQGSSPNLAASSMQAEEDELDLTPSSFDVPASNLPASEDLSPAPNLSSPSPKKEEGYEPELIPFTLEDLGLTPEEIESLSTGSFGQGSESKDSRPESTENDELDFTPFSLDDLGLSEENLDLFAPPPEAKKPSSSKPVSSPPSPPKAFADEPALDPFSAETFDLPHHDSAPSLPSKAVASSTSDSEPFSFDDFELGDLETAAPPPPARAKVQAPPKETVEPSASEVEPFSFDDFGVDDLEPVEPPPPARAKVQASPKEAVESSASEVEPFSFDDFGVDDLETAAPPPPARAKVQAPPKEAVESSASEVEPFSFDDFGFGELETTSPPSPPADKPRLQTKSQPTLRVKSQPKSPVDLNADLSDSEDDEDDEGSLTPFSFEDFGLPESQPTPPPPVKSRIPGSGTIARDTVRLESGVEPFSIDDLGFNFSADVLNAEDETDSSRLGLTTDELAGMDLGQFEEHTKPQTRALSDDLLSAINRSSPSDDMALDQLLELGQKQGFVDLTDIINIFEDPVAESERIEEIGRALYRAGIQIRDGDEIIPMEDDENYIEDFDALESQVASDSQPAVVTPSAPPTEEPELTPFSLQELGLTDDEIAALNAANTEDFSVPSAPPAAHVASAPEPEAEPELTPFSLQELGLTDDEIAALNAANAEDDFSVPSAPVAAVASAPESEAEPELTPFSLQELGLTDDEIAALNAANTEDLSVPSTPVAAVASAPEPEAEPELTPFSLQELGLTDDEIAALNAANTEDFSVPSVPAVASASVPTPEAEPELTPFSLQDLGLTDEEIAALNAANAEDFSVPSAPVLPELAVTEDPVASAPAPEAEPELTPFSLQDLGLTDEEIATLNAASAEDFSVPAAPIPTHEAEPELTPFSLQELGLTDDEIAALNAASASEAPSEKPSDSDDEIIPFDLEAFCQAETESAALKQAKQQQGRPNSKQPHHVSISLADLGLTEEVRNALLGTEGSSSQASPKASYSSSQPIQPISPESLGLSADAVAALGLLAKGGKDSAATILIPNASSQPFPQPAKPPQGDARAQTTPPEQKVSLPNLAEVTPLASPPSGMGPGMEADWFNFESSEAQPQQKPKSSPVPPATAKKQPLSPEDAAFVPAALDTLDDIWPPESFAPKATPAQPPTPAPVGKSSPSAPARQPANEPARPVSWPPQQPDVRPSSLALEGPSSERSDAKTSYTGRPTPPLRRSSSSRLSSQGEASRPGRVSRYDSSQSAAAAAPTPPPSRGEIRATPPLRGEAFPLPRSTRGGREGSRVARPRRSDAYRSNVGTAPEAFIPTGNTELDEYLHQLELEPGNWQLRLAIARIGIQTNRLDLAIHHYKRLIKDDRSGDQVIVDLQESIDETDDQYLLQRLYRLLGDAYAQQDRYREAVAAYGCVFQR